MRWPSLLPLLPLLAAASAAPSDTATLSAMLARLAASHGANTQRDAGPELTPVKQALRSWVERRLPPLPGAGAAASNDPDALAQVAAAMNRALDEARLTCGGAGTADDRCGDPAAQEDDRGHLGPVRLGWLDGGRYLAVVTGVGVRCGFDQSVYVYEGGSDRRWHLLLASEQDDYGPRYAPQTVMAIDVSPAGVAWNERAPPPLVATLGVSPWCSSNWQALFTRVGRATPATPTPRPLIDRADTLYMGEDFVAAERLTADDLLVQFAGQSADSGKLIRQHVLHYRLRPGDRLERIAPVALDPADFVEEWRASPWHEAAGWLDARADATALARRHRPDGPGEFTGLPTRCRADPSLWQGGLTDGDGRNTLWFRVRWLAPYGFTMLGAGPHRAPGCDEATAAPGATGTLFPLTGWTPR